MTIALIIAALLCSVSVILLFPVNISFNSVRSGETIDGSLGVGWIIFLFIYSLKEKELKIHIFGRGIFHHTSPEKRPHVQERKRERKKSWKMSPGKMFPGKMPPRDFLNMTGPLLRLFKDFIYVFRIKYLDIEVAFGLNDPAYTGIITGFLHAIGLSQRRNIRWRADFTGQTFDWDIKGKIALIPVRLIPPVARFITNRKVLRYGWLMMRNQSNV